MFGYVLTMFDTGDNYVPANSSSSIQITHAPFCELGADLKAPKSQTIKSITYTLKSSTSIWLSHTSVVTFEFKVRYLHYNLVLKRERFWVDDRH